MIINSKTISLSHAVEMLNMSEHEVLRLCQYGYLEQGKLDKGNIRINLNSIEKYAYRSGIALRSLPKHNIERSESFTIKETMNKLELKNEITVHKLIQSGKLKAEFKLGDYVINLQSIHDYVTGRC